MAPTQRKWRLAELLRGVLVVALEFVVRVHSAYNTGDCRNSTHINMGDLRAYNRKVARREAAIARKTTCT